ncbi:uncharacterized protein LOC134209100 [Armigeres subalbatus]|uniref:uncharacterized protein LOC134209100 n=1 Tax=Armigeres subalbatus TaxID=124917 RepID=UPI002ED66931
MAPDLRALSKQERFCFDTLNNVAKFIGGYDEARDKGEIVGWIDRLEGIFEKFLKIRLEIDLLQDDDSATADEDEKASRASRDKFDKTYVQQRGLVESIDITDANYVIAWQDLTKRFDNKKLVVKTYLDALLSVESMKRESYESLSRLVDDFERNLQMIEKMNIDTKGWSVLLAHMVCSRLDTLTLKQWENHHKSTDVPQYQQLIEFLRSHCIVLQSIAPGKPNFPELPRSEPGRVQKFKTSSVHTIVSSSSKPFKCDAFRKLPISERYDLVKKRSLCINCLSADHQVRSCSSGSCRVCGQKHHTMLHHQAPIRNPTQPQPSKQTASQPTTTQTHSQISIALAMSSNASKTSSPTPLVNQSCPTTGSLSHCSTSSVDNVRLIPSTVLLQKALVKVVDSSKNILWARALLDPASQLNIMSEGFAQRLQVQRIKENHIVGGIGQSSVASTYSLLVYVQSHCCSFRTQLKFHVLKSVTRELPSNSIDVAEWSWPSNVVLADPQFNQPAAVDMIIGVDAYYDLLLDGLIRLGPGRPVLQNTLLGWVVSGRVGDGRPNPEIISIEELSSTWKRNNIP